MENVKNQFISQTPSETFNFCFYSSVMVHMLMLHMVPSCGNEIKAMFVKVKHQLNINFDSLDLASPDTSVQCSLYIHVYTGK